MCIQLRFIPHCPPKQHRSGKTINAWLITCEVLKTWQVAPIYVIKCLKIDNEYIKEYIVLFEVCNLKKRTNVT